MATQVTKRTVHRGVKNQACSPKAHSEKCRDARSQFTNDPSAGSPTEQFTYEYFLPMLSHRARPYLKRLNKTPTTIWPVNCTRIH